MILALYASTVLKWTARLQWCFCFYITLCYV